MTNIEAYSIGKDYATKTIADSATAIITNGKRTLIHNNGDAIIYLGGDDSVATTDGMPLIVDAYMVIIGTAYGIVATGTQDLRIVSVE